MPPTARTGPRSSCTGLCPGCSGIWARRRPALAGARPMNATTVPSRLRIGSMARSRKVSMSVPRQDSAQPGRLDDTVAVAECPQMLDEGGPPGGRVPGLPAPLHGRAEPAAFQVAGDPAACQSAAEEPGGCLVSPGELVTWPRQRAFCGCLRDVREDVALVSRLRFASARCRAGRGTSSRLGQGCLQMRGDLGGSAEDPAGDRADGRVRVVARAGPGPAGDARERAPGRRCPGRWRPGRRRSRLRLCGSPGTRRCRNDRGRRSRRAAGCARAGGPARSRPARG